VTAGNVSDPVALSWLVTVRWTTVLAAAGTVMAGLSGLQTAVPIGATTGVLGAFAISNLWLMWRIRGGRSPATVTIAGAFVCADVVLLTGLLLRFGGVLNPASVFYLVQIVMVALVLGRTWTWIVTTLSVIGYATLFVTPTTALDAAQVMHPEIGLHMRGMWIAFALTAVIIGVLVTRLALAIEQRDHQLDLLRERTARAMRFSGLTTLATGAAHELSTPLASMAVAAHELERELARRPDDRSLHEDARLIRSEIDRCRGILDDMAGQSGEPLGEAPRPTTIVDVLHAIETRLSQAERRRVRTRLRADIPVVWPVEVVARAIFNLVRNGLQASTELSEVEIDVVATDDGHVQISVVDRGSGMAPEHLARAGEPFFTTKAPGIGTGLGLFVTRSSIEQLGGTFSLTSVPGQGTTAHIVLPLDVVSTRSPAA
jgi:two-component system sensor histidine kinase RegB